MNRTIIVKKGTKSQILGYFYRILAGMSAKPSHRKFFNDESKVVVEGFDDEAKIYTGTIRRL